MATEEPEYNPINLATIANGAALELFERELSQVLDNIVDPNTEAKAKREITIKVRFSPGEDRDIGAVDITAASKLVAANGAATQVFIGRVHGQVVAIENDPKQLQMQFDESNRPIAFTGGKDE